MNYYTSRGSANDPERKAQREGEEARIRKRKPEETREEILNLLPLKKEYAITARDIMGNVKAKGIRTLSSNLGTLSKRGVCCTETRYFGPGVPRQVYWTSEEQLNRFHIVKPQGHAQAVDIAEQNGRAGIANQKGIILDMFINDNELSTREITDRLADLGYTYEIRSIRRYLSKPVMGGELRQSGRGSRGMQSHYAVTSNPYDSVAYFTHKYPQTVDELIKEHLPRTEEEAITSKELHAIGGGKHRFTYITSGLSKRYLLGLIKRRGDRPYRYWKEQTEEETEKPMRGSHDPLIDTPSIDMTPRVEPHSTEQDILARIESVEKDIASIHERYRNVESALKERQLDARLKEAEKQRDEEGSKLERLEEELRGGIQKMRMQPGGY